MVVDSSHRRSVIRSLADKLRYRLHNTDSHGESGISALPTALPWDRMAAGMLVEWLRDASEISAEVLALQGVRNRLANHPGFWAVIDAAGAFCPSCLTGWGIAAERLVVIRPRSDADLWWATEQALRCGGIAETWCWVERVSDTILRRWKLALEASGGTGVLFRSACVRRQPSWADVRWQVTAKQGMENQGRLVRVELVSCRGEYRTGAVDLEIDDGTGVVRLVSPVAPATPLDRGSLGSMPSTGDFKIEPSSGLASGGRLP